jgi:hypothetical protein
LHRIARPLQPGSTPARAAEAAAAMEKAEFRPGVVSM